MMNVGVCAATLTRTAAGTRWAWPRFSMPFKRFAGRDESNGRRWLSRLVGSPFCSTLGCGAFRIRSQLLRVAKAHRVRIRRLGDFDDIFQVKISPILGK